MSCFFVIQYCDKSFWALSLDYCVINLLCFLLFIMLYKHNMAKDPDNGFFPKQVLKKDYEFNRIFWGRQSPFSSIVFPLYCEQTTKKDYPHYRVSKTKNRRNNDGTNSPPYTDIQNHNITCRRRIASPITNAITII